MAKKRASSSRKTSGRRTPAKKKSGFSLGKFTLGLIILMGLGYGALAIWEGKLVPDSLSDFELPEILDEPLNTEPAQPTQPNTKPEPEVETPKPTTSGTNAAPSQTQLEAFDLYFTAAFDFMWPRYSTNETIIERPYYTIRYSEPHEQAIWVAYKLSADSLKQKTYERKDDFREDPRVRTKSASLADYKGSGYDRGHLAPAADFSYDEFALSQSFYMSNMSPQNPSFNRGIWKKLEEQVRDWAMENDNIYVVTGPVLSDGLTTIGKNEVAIPKYYYKIVLDVQKPEIKAIAFLMKNEGSKAELSSFVVTIDSVEQLTGLDFFPSMPDDMERMLESSKSTTGWKW